MPVIGFARISGGAPSSVRSLTNHLINQTMPKEEQKLAAYYTKGLALSSERLVILRPDMHPAVAEKLGVDATVPLTRENIDALLSGRRADGEKVEGKTYAEVRDLGVNPRTGEHKLSTPIGSYDFCPQPHKSVSVAFAFASEPERAMILNAHLDAARFAVGEIAKGIGVRRLGEGGQDGHEPGHVTWLEFTHLTERRTRAADGTERAGDMGLHTHMLIPNAVVTDEGRVGSLHTAKVRGLIWEASALYNARLASNLREGRFRAEFDPETKTCVMPDVPDVVCEHFSKRSHGMEAEAQAVSKERGENWSKLTPEEKEARVDQAGQTIKWSNKGGKDDEANFADWRRQADENAEAWGWRPPESCVNQTAAPDLTPEQRIRSAYEVALPILEQVFEEKSVISRSEIRSIAGYGLIHAGIDDARDVNAVTELMRKQGVTQYGERTTLVWAEDDARNNLGITTELHEAHEREFIELARAAANDRSMATPRDLLERKISESGLDFSDDHGKAQLAMIRRLSTDGKFTVGIAAAGAGKTAGLGCQVAAWKEQGREVWGVSVAHRQADALTEAGIVNVTALSGPALPKAKTFAEAARSGHIQLNEKSVVVIDEFAQLGTRQGLELLRLRAQHGFSLICIGDDKQCASIAAGAIVDLTRKALGPERIPEIFSTKRQQAEREIQFVSLLRKGQAKDALDIKRAHGEAIMAEAGYKGAVAEVAKRYAERLRQTGDTPGVATPTNREAHDISLAIRAERRAMGQLGPDIARIRATGQEGHDYLMNLAIGDRVRLFASAKARFPDGSGGVIGRNGSAMEIIGLGGQGMSVRNCRNGKQGLIAWESLTNSKDRVRLAYGDCGTINAMQGLGKNGFIVAFPSGSKGVNARKAYSANTRFESWSCIVTSGQAERAEVRQSRPLDDARPITLDDLWGNVGKHFADQTTKDLALSLLDRAATVYRAAVKGFAQSVQPAELRKAHGEAPSFAHEKAAEKRAERSMDLAVMRRAVTDRRAAERSKQQQRRGPSLSM